MIQKQPSMLELSHHIPEAHRVVEIYWSEIHKSEEA